MSRDDAIPPRRDNRGEVDGSDDVEPRQVERQGEVQAAMSAERRDTRIGVEASLLPALFERPGVAMVSVDAQGRVTALSPLAEALLGFDQDDLLGGGLHERVHYQRPDGSPLPASDCPIQRAVRESRVADGEDQVFVRKDGTTLPVAWSVAPIVLAGLRTGTVLAFHENRAAPPRSDHQARLEAVQAANIRLTLLADTSHALISAQDLRKGLADVARLLVPAAADWVVLDLVDQQTGRVKRAALAHRDPHAQAEGLAQLGDLGPLHPEMVSPLPQILRGAPAARLTWFPPVEEAIDPLGAARLQLFHLLGASDAITAPMRTRSRTVGAITLVRTDPNRPYEPTDLTFVEDLATRIALEVENATLLDQYERRAETMQRSLLPDVPPLLHDVHLGHLYRPADDLAKVGGDWYDAFPLQDGSIALVIGDVVGHDLHAATRMGAIRHKLRALATDQTDPPSTVLHRLDRVVQQLGTGDMATLLYAQLTPLAGSTPHEQEARTATRTASPSGCLLEWSSAGHPPPLLLEPAREPRLLSTHADLPIGVSLTERADQRHPLPDEAAVILYTDGLVKRAGESLDVGFARLIEAARTLRLEDIGTLPERLLTAVHPATDDDLAILAMHTPHSR